MPDECEDRYAKRSETKERKQFEQWLEWHPEIVVCSARTDKRTTIKKGWPDFSLFCAPGLTLFLDFKSTGKTLDEDQQKVRDQLVAAGHTFLVPYSAGEAIREVKEFFRISA